MENRYTITWQLPGIYDLYGGIYLAPLHGLSNYKINSPSPDYLAITWHLPLPGIYLAKGQITWKPGNYLASGNTV